MINLFTVYTSSCFQETLVIVYTVFFILSLISKDFAGLATFTNIICCDIIFHFH